MSDAFLTRAIGLGILLPGLVALVVLLGMRRAGRVWPPLADFAGPLALALGFCSGYFALELGPLWPALAGADWLPHLVVAAIPAGWICARSSRPEVMILALATTAFAAAIPIIPSWAGPARMKAFWAFPLGEVSLVVAIVLDRAARGLPETLVAAALAICAFASASILMLADLQSPPQMAAMMGSVLAASALAIGWGRPVPGARAIRGMIPGFAVLSSGLLFYGYQQSFSRVPAKCYAIVALAPLALGIGLLPIARRLPPLWRSILSLAVLLILLGVALTLAGRVSSPIDLFKLFVNG